jgi:hypothetical protein
MQLIAVALIVTEIEDIQDLHFHGGIGSAPCRSFPAALTTDPLKQFANLGFWQCIELLGLSRLQTRCNLLLLVNQVHY